MVGIFWEGDKNKVVELEKRVYEKVLKGDYLGGLSALEEYFEYTQKPENFPEDLREHYRCIYTIWKKVISLAQEEGWDGSKAVEECQKIYGELKKIEDDEEKIKSVIFFANATLDYLVPVGKEYGVNSGIAEEVSSKLKEYIRKVSEAIENSKKELIK